MAENTLFESPLIRVLDYRCQGTAAENGDDESVDDVIVLPRTGTFERFDREGRHVANVNHVLFFHKGQSYAIKHPVSGGDASTVFAPTRPVLMDILRNFDPYVDDDPESPFPHTYSSIDHAGYLFQHRLLFSLLSQGRLDTLEAEERLLVFLGNVVHSAFNAAKDKSRMRTSPAGLDIVEDVKLVLAARMREKLTLQTIADAVSCSPYTLCRLFKQVVGMSVHRYLLRLRLLGAMDELAESPDSRLVDVAIKLGFSSHSRFSAAFRREFDTSPSEFRRATSGSPDILGKIRIARS